MSRKESGCDYVAEIIAAPEGFIETFKDVLKDKHAVITECVDKSKSTFVSHAKTNSFLKEFVLAIPGYFEWSVEQLTIKKCRLTIAYRLSTNLKIGLYILCFILGTISFVSFYFISIYAKSDKDDFIVQMFGGIAYLGCVYLCVAILCIILSLMLMFLGIRFKLFSKTILNVVFGRLGYKGKSLIHEKPLFKGRYSVHNLLVILFLCAVFLPPALMVPEKIFEIIKGMHDFIIMIIVSCVILLVLDYINKNDSFKVAKSSTLACSLLLAICVLLLISFLPYQLISSSKNAVKSRVTYILETEQDNASVIEDLGSYEKVIRIPGLGDRQTLIRRWSLLKITYFLGWSIAFIVIYYCSKYFVYFVEGQHNIDLKREVFNKRSSLDSFDSSILELSFITKIIIVFLFIVCSAFSWYGVYLNILILNALLFPHHIVAFSSYGETVSMGISIMAEAFLWPSDSPFKLYLFRWLLAIPAVSPFSLLAYLHFRHIKLVRKKLKNFVILDDKLSKEVKKIAKDMGIKRVECLEDTSSTLVTPYAEIRGFSKRIILSKQTLSFITTYPQYMVAIMAHEIGHLKNDCSYRRLLACMSRFGLIGSGFMSILLNTAACEKEADKAAYAYLRQKKMDESLLDDAIDAMRKHMYMDKKWGSEMTQAALVTDNGSNGNIVPEENIKAAYKIDFSKLEAFLSGHIANKSLRKLCNRCFASLASLLKLLTDINNMVLKPILQRVMKPLRIVYIMYFERKAFDNIHRQEYFKSIRKRHRA